MSSTAATTAGETIFYIPMGSDERILITVTEASDDIKNGLPGFTGRTADGRLVWGYDDQID